MKAKELVVTPFSSILGCGIWDGEKHLVLVPNNSGKEDAERLASIILRALAPAPLPPPQEPKKFRKRLIELLYYTLAPIRNSDRGERHAVYDRVSEMIAELESRPAALAGETRQCERLIDGQTCNQRAELVNCSFCDEQAKEGDKLKAKIAAGETRTEAQFTPIAIQIRCLNCDGQGSTPVTMDMAIDAGDRTMAGGTTCCMFCNGEGFRCDLPEPDSAEWWKQAAQKLSIDYFDLNKSTAAAQSRIAQLERERDEAKRLAKAWETDFDSLARKLDAAERGLAEAKKDAGWKSTHEMYRNAWIRALGGWLVPKSHEIDSLVLTTRKRCVNPLLGNCTEPHWLNKSASDEKDWQQTPHPNDGCRNWKADDSEPNPRAETAEAALTQAQQERELWEKWKTNAYIAEMLSDFQKIRHADLGVGRALAERWGGPTYPAIALQVDIAEILKLRAQKSALMEAIEPFAKTGFGSELSLGQWQAAARVYEQVKWNRKLFLSSRIS